MKRLLIFCSVIALGIGLGACSSSTGGLMDQASLAGEASAMCDSGSGTATGIAALNPQAAHAQCMQDQYAAGQAGYNEEEGYFAPGSHATSLLSNGQ
jgi:hypothetical protein